MNKEGAAAAPSGDNLGSAVQPMSSLSAGGAPVAGHSPGAPQDNHDDRPPAPAPAPATRDDEGFKVFVGGLSWDTNEDSLRNYFSTFGDVNSTVIMRDRITGQPRGFGFVSFASQDAANAVAAQRHDLDGRQVEAKHAVPRSDLYSAGGSHQQRHQSDSRPSSQNAHAAGVGHFAGPGSQLGGPGQPGDHARLSTGSAGGGGGPASGGGGVGGGGGGGGGGSLQSDQTNARKVFVGGLPSHCTNDDFREFFTQFGAVADALVMVDHKTGHSRGFGFITFIEEAGVDNCIRQGLTSQNHEMMGKMVEVKRAEPKNQAGRARGPSGPPSNQGANNAAYAPAGNYSTGLSPMLAAQYASYYGGTPQSWQNYVAAATAAAANAGYYGQNNPGQFSGDFSNPYAAMYAAYNVNQAPGGAGSVGPGGGENQVPDAVAAAAAAAVAAVDASNIPDSGQGLQHGQPDSSSAVASETPGQSSGMSGSEIPTGGPNEQGNNEDDQSGGYGPSRNAPKTERFHPYGR